MDIFFTKDLKSKLMQKLEQNISAIKSKGTNPRMDLIVVGNNPDAASYARVKQKFGETLGIQVKIDFFNENISTDELEKIIISKNNNSKIHGIILESPFPQGVDFDFLAEKVVYNKDIDGLTSKNIGFLMNNQDRGLLSATPLACVEILEAMAGQIQGMDITLIGNGKTVGKPLAQMLINRGASVNICHSLTHDLASHCRNSDAIIVAAGCPKLLTTDMVNSNQIIIDVGTNYTPDGLVGDVDFESVKDKVKAITPVPGGVGPITTVKIFQNLVKAIGLQTNFDIFDISLGDHIKIASSSSLPGGGAISCLGAVYGASMINMVCELTKEEPNKINAHKSQLAKNISMLQKLYEHDINIYNEFLDTLKLPKDSDEQKEFRKHRLAKLSIKACEIPINGIKVCLNCLKIANDVLSFSSSSAINDVYVGKNFLVAAIRSLRKLVQGNQSSIKDEEYQTYLNNFENKIEKFLS